MTSFQAYSIECQKFFDTDVFSVKNNGEHFFKRIIAINYATNYIGISNSSLESLTCMPYFNIAKNKVYFNRLSKDHVFNFVNEMFVKHMSKLNFKQQYIEEFKQNEKDNINKIKKMLQIYNEINNVDILNHKNSLHKLKFANLCKQKQLPKYLVANVLCITENYINKLERKK